MSPFVETIILTAATLIIAAFCAGYAAVQWVLL